MEINVTKSSLDLARAVLHEQLKFCAKLKKQIKIVEAQGATSPDGLKTTSKKAAPAAKAAKAAPAAKAAKAAPAAKKAVKNAAKSAPAAKNATKKASASTKTVHRSEDGKRIPLRTRVLDYVKKTYKTDEVWTPKMILSKDEFEGTGNVHLSQVLKELCGEGTGEKKINKISKGKYQTL